MLRLNAKFKSFGPRFIARKNRGKHDALTSEAARYRRAERNLLRIVRGPARAGAAPHAHTRSGLRFILFHVSGNTALIGPVRFPARMSRPAPNVHEKGGLVTFFRPFPEVAFYPRRPFAEKVVKRLGPTTPKKFAVTLGNALS